MSVQTRVITDDDISRVKAAANSLIEHFDSVRIFVTKHDGPSDATGGYSTGKGNYHAQEGQIHEWLVMKDAEARQDATEHQKGDEE